MEIRINKEIQDYRESIFFGLSARQLLFSLLAAGTAVLLYLGLHDLARNSSLGCVYLRPHRLRCLASSVTTGCRLNPFCAHISAANSFAQRVFRIALCLCMRGFLEKNDEGAWDPLPSGFAVARRYVFAESIFVSLFFRIIGHAQSES